MIGFKNINHLTIHTNYTITTHNNFLVIRCQMCYRLCSVYCLAHIVKIKQHSCRRLSDHQKNTRKGELKSAKFLIQHQNTRTAKAFFPYIADIAYTDFDVDVILFLFIYLFIIYLNKYSCYFFKIFQIKSLPELRTLFFIKKQIIITITIIFHALISMTTLYISHLYNNYCFILFQI